MPFANFTKVREVSSEDNVHLAENLINNKAGKKWKTRNAGEKSAYVILEMSENYKITGIDIGNEHSAFVEVLVGKSACVPENFTEILITCSFMTPTESKSSGNTNRVRCFNREALVPSVAENKWSLVKIVCTQPFNKHVQYGLSFIKVHIENNTNDSSLPKKNISNKIADNKTQRVGNFKFREESPDSEGEHSFKLFNRWKISKHNDEPSSTAKLLLTPRFNDDSKPETSHKRNDTIIDRNREKLVFDKEDDTKNTNKKKLERLSAHIEIDKKRRRLELEKEMNKSAKKSIKTNTSLPLACIQKQEETSIKSIRMPSRKVRPFNQLLKGVVLVISGIQNPDRGDLRNKAITLGAKYKADWDDTCTHLICAFKNTPKYNQVKGKGKIVTRGWIEKCYNLKKYLPWRRYAIDSKDLSQPESDEEIFECSENSQIDETSNNSNLDNTTSNKLECEEMSTSLTLYNTIDGNSKASHLANNLNSSSSESDTDDEIKRVEENIIAAKMNTSSPISDIYEASTEEEDYVNEKLDQHNSKTDA